MSGTGDAGDRLRRLLIGPPRRALAVAESVTCGGIQQRIGRVSGASEYFLGGVTAYAARLKAELLGVDLAEAQQMNSVSPEIAGQMARGVCARFGAEVGLATTGYAEPNGAWKVAAPFAFWAVAFAPPGGGAARVVANGRVECARCSRAEAQDRIADEALGALAAILETK